MTGPAFYDTAHGPDFFLAVAISANYCYKVRCKHPRAVKNMLPKQLLKEMDSDESGRSESEFYYPEEETFNQITPINRDEVEQDRQLSNIQDFIYSLRPDNTKKKTTYDLNIFGEDTVPQLERQEPWKKFLPKSSTYFCAGFSWTSVKKMAESTSQVLLHLSREVFNAT